MPWLLTSATCLKIPGLSLSRKQMRYYYLSRLYITVSRVRSLSVRKKLLYTISDVSHPCAYRLDLLFHLLLLHLLLLPADAGLNAPCGLSETGWTSSMRRIRRKRMMKHAYCRVLLKAIKWNSIYEGLRETLLLRKNNFSSTKSVHFFVFFSQVTSFWPKRDYTPLDFDPPLDLT